MRSWQKHLLSKKHLEIRIELSGAHCHCIHTSTPVLYILDRTKARGGYSTPNKFGPKKNTSRHNTCMYTLVIGSDPNTKYSNSLS